MSDEQPILRRFNLGDGMIVIGALATFLAVVKAMWQDTVMSLQAWRDDVSSGPIPVWVLCTNVSAIALMFVALMFLAFAAMRLRKPRPSLHDVCLQPGMVACETAALYVAFGCTTAFFAIPHPAVIVPGFLLTSLALPLSWGLLAVTRRWRPEKSWIDRLGRVLGVCWWIVSWIYFAGIVRLLNVL